MMTFRTASIVTFTKIFVSVTSQPSPLSVPLPAERYGSGGILNIAVTSSLQTPDLSH
jgi:hypothetical protein